MKQTFKIIRYFADGNKDIIKTGLTKDQAQVHCNNPETASKTATNMDEYTQEHGEWFDGYTPTR